MKPLCSIFLVMLGFISASAQTPSSVEVERLLLHQSVNCLTETMVQDVFTPPVASRVYAYSMLALYEGIYRNDPAYRSYEGQLKGLLNLPKPNPNKTYHWQLVGTQSFFETASKFVFSPNKLNERRQVITEKLQAMNIPPDVYANSVQLGNDISAAIVAWSKGDNYGRTRSMRRYTIQTGEDKWKPTPPTYTAALEPNWGQLRPFVMDSTSQFRVELPPKFDMTPNAVFHQEVMRVYDLSKQLTDEQKWIVEFWDDNPYSIQYQGHLAFAIKKISPGAHWIGITEMATNTQNESLVGTAAAYSMVALALADGFIASWEQKYANQLVRPITVIRQHIDPNWNPMLQTPPFPEHTSGHSTISMSAATVLTHLYGDKFAFTDRSEETYGIRPRTFSSFEEASTEAGMSRLYGGIHYLTGITAGRKQGKLVGENVMRKIKLKSN